MNELITPDIAYGVLALAAVVLYAAWHEYRSKNHRDGKLLTVVGAVCLMGSAGVWLQ